MGHLYCEGSVLTTLNEAIIEAFEALGGERTIDEIRNWVASKYGRRWNDSSFGTSMADMVPQELGGNPSSSVPNKFRVLKRVSIGSYCLFERKSFVVKEHLDETQFFLRNFSQSLDSSKMSLNEKESRKSLLGIEGEVDWLKEGVAQYELGRLEEALKCFEMAIKLNPNNEETWMGKGLVLGGLGRFEEALLSYDKAIEIDPNNEDAWFNKGWVLNNLEKTEDQIKCFDKCIELNPNNPKTWIFKGWTLNKLGRFEEAIACYNRAIGLDPNYEIVWFSKGLLLGRSEKFEESVECYDKAIEINPNNCEAWFNKGLALGNLERFEEAVKCYDKAIEINPNNFGAWFKKGLTLCQIECYDEALLCFNKAIEICPNNCDGWTSKGRTLHELGRFDEAIKCYHKGIELNPTAKLAWSNKGLTLDKLGRFEEAIKCYNRAIEISPNDYFPWFNKGLTLNNLSRFKDALQSFDKAIEISPENEDAWFNRGLTLDQLGRSEDAVQSYDKAIEINPSNGFAWTNKATTLSELGRTEEAHECYLRALTISMKNENASSNQYLVLPGRNSVEVWSEKRLPFEPKGWLLSLRDDIRSAIADINCDQNQVLHAVYLSSILESSDVDNILFYNVGVEYFQQTGYAGLRFERSFLPAPPPPTGSAIGSVQHYQRYMSEPKERYFEHWIQVRTLVKWNSSMTADNMVKLKKTKNPAYVWFAVKSGTIQNVSEFQGIPLEFGVRLKIRVPSWITSSFIDLLKPLLDGTIGAFHHHDGMHEESVAKHLTSILEVRAQDIISYLRENTNSVLGTRTLFWLRQDGIQWNPADDQCVATELLFENSNNDKVEYSGELFEVRENTEGLISLQADDGSLRVVHHELIFNSSEFPDCTRPSGTSHLTWIGCKKCFNWKCGYSMCIAPSQFLEGALCVYEHCIENMPFEENPLRCNIFGHLCPGGAKQLKECNANLPYLTKRLAERYSEYSSMERFTKELFDKKHPNKGKFTRKDMQFCESVLTRFGRGEHMWVVITKITDEGIEGRVDNTPTKEGSPKYGEHVFVCYKEIEDVH
jgi:tetratricopeptide (TPR) repeat protein